MLDRFAIGVDRLGPVGRLDERGGRFGWATGGALVTGDQGEASQVIAIRRGRIEPQGIGRSPVEEPSSGQARRLVGDVADPAVREVVPDRRTGPAGHLPDEPAVHQLLDGVDRLLFRPTAGQPQDRELEHPADDRRRRQDLARGLPDGGDPLEEQRLDATRQGRTRIVTAGDRRDHVEREPLGVGGQGVDHGIVHRVGRAHRADDGGHTGTIEPFRARARVVPGRRASSATEVAASSSGPRVARRAGGAAGVRRGAWRGTRAPRASGRRRGAGRPPRPARARPMPSARSAPRRSPRGA